MRIVCSMVILAAGLAGGCGKEEEHKHGEPAHGAGPSGPSPTTYAAAMEQMEKHSGNIASLIAAGKLADVHHEAEEIKRIAEGLPELAKSMAPDMLKVVNLKSKEIAGMFGEIDEAADAGKKDETVKLHEKLKGLIADLRKHATHEEHK